LTPTLQTRSSSGSMATPVRSAFVGAISGYISGEIRQARTPRRVYGIVGHPEPAPEIINELQLRERRDAFPVKPLSDGAAFYADQSGGNFNFSPRLRRDVFW
jgi:hypothetical protein